MVPSGPTRPVPAGQLLQPSGVPTDTATDTDTSTGTDAQAQAAGNAAAGAGDPLQATAPESTPRQQRIRRRLQQRRPEWFSAFLAGNSREKTRFKREMATIRGSVVWLVRQRRQGLWTVQERAHLRQVMRTASSVSPYLVIWVVPGSLLLLPFLAWFIDHRRRGRHSPATPTLPLPPSLPPPGGA